MHFPEPDLFHAVDGGGNCLPGPCVPFGLVRPGPDMVNHNTSGYATGEDIRHFSHLHVAGTGGAGRYGNIGIVPLGQYPDRRSAAFKSSGEEASPGYYAVTLAPRQGFGEMANPGSIRCALTTTGDGAVHNYVWSAGLEPWIRIDLGTCIAGYSLGGWSRWVNPQYLVGRADYRGGWGHEEPYSVYFALSFDHPMVERWVESAHHPLRDAGSGEGPGQMLIARVAEGKNLEIAVGLSFVSVAQAEQNRPSGGEAGNCFAMVRRAAEERWTELLQRFPVEGGEDWERTLWSTFWMRLHTMPGIGKGGQFPWFGGDRPQVNDLYCLWDSARCANSLFALVDPAFAVLLTDALIEIGEETGWVPDAWIMGASAQVQGGCSAAVLFAEGAVKHLPGFRAREAWEVLRQTQENPSDDPFFRGRFPAYARLGYLPEGVPNCASRTVEYAFHDACAAKLARAAGEDGAAGGLEKRAQRIWESYCPESGCFAPRDEAGAFVAFDPWRPQCRDFWNDPHYYEGTGYDYSLGAWFTIPEQVRRWGGDAAFAAHLDAFLERCHLWKEINLHVPWLYHFVGDPDRSGKALRALADRLVKPGRKGLPDNEDMGAWSSWWLSAAMGVGPVPGSALYLLAAPRFPFLSVGLKGSRAPLVIRREGEDPAEGFLEAIILNGQPLDRAWVGHQEIAEGGELLFRIGKNHRKDWVRPFPEGSF